TPITGSAIAKNFILIDFQPNRVTWTMYIEVICSLLLPIQVAITLRGKSVGLGLLFILIVAAWLTPSGYDAQRYLFCFQIGIFLACYPDLFRNMQQPAAFFVGGIILQRLPMINDVKSTILEAIGAAMILVAVLAARSIGTFKWLELAPLRF